jgi:hypothetical protein
MNAIKNFITMDSRRKWIPMTKCKNGYVYYIHARNSHIGIYDEKEKGFIISRHKFNDNYLFTEYHWDTGAPYGTVKPIKKLCKAPEFKEDEAKLAWLNKKCTEINKNPWYKGDKEIKWK